MDNERRSMNKETIMALGLLALLVLGFYITYTAPVNPELRISRSAAYWHEVQNFQEEIEITDINTGETHKLEVLLEGQVPIM